MSCEIQERKRQNVDAPKFYQKNFFHIGILLVLGLLVCSVKLPLIIGLVLLVCEIIFILLQKIYTKTTDGWIISKPWMFGLIVVSSFLLVYGICKIGRVLR